LPDWNVENYLFDFEDIHFSGNIVDAPLPVKVGWVTRYLHDIIFPDVIRAITHGGELSGLLLSFSIVDYLAGYFVGRRSQAKDFITFLNEYFPKQYMPFARDVYDHLRSGIVHNLSLQNPWMPAFTPFALEKQSDFHLQNKNGKVVFSITHFVEDTRRSMVMYFHDLVMKSSENETLVNNFHTRFNKHSGAASMMTKDD